jgi:hypothetical protein
MKNEFERVGEIFVRDNAFGYGDLCVSGIDVRLASGEHYEPDHLAVARA